MSRFVHCLHQSVQLVFNWSLTKIISQRKKTDRRKNHDRKIATNKEPTTLIDEDYLQISTLDTYIVEKIADSLMLLVLTEMKKPSNRLKSYKPKNHFLEKKKRNG